MRIIGTLVGTGFGYGVGYAIASWVVGEMGQAVSDGRFAGYGLLLVVVALLAGLLSRSLGLALLILLLVGIPSCGITFANMAQRKHLGSIYYSGTSYWTEPHLATLCLGIPFAVYGALVGYKAAVAINKKMGFRAKQDYFEQEVNKQSEREEWYESEEESFEYEESAHESYYDILGVKHNATKDEIKKAYREKMKAYHPDKFTNQPEWVNKQAEEMSKKINEAYEILMKRS